MTTIMFFLKPSLTKTMKIQMLLTFLLLIEIVIPTTEAALANFTNCTDSPNYTPNSPFHANLNDLLTTLPSNASLTGFYNSSVGQNHDKAYALYLCWGDSGSRDCRDCVNNAQQSILQQCPLKYWDAIWFDDCMLRFSNMPFLHAVDYNPSRVVANPNHVPSDVTQFTETLRNIMKDLAPQVARNSVRFGTKEGDINGTSLKLFALGQCTPDLTIDDCEQCLQIAIKQLPFMHGARVLLPSCNVQFEFNQFFRSDIANSSFFLPPNTNAKTNTIASRPETRPSSVAMTLSPSLNMFIGLVISVVATFINYVFYYFI